MTSDFNEMASDFNVRKINVRYSEDFRRNQVAARIYSILRDNNLDPITVVTRYEIKTGLGEASYIFDGSTELPDESALEKMLSEINITGLEIKKSACVV